MWVKICANTNVEDALLATELGADAVGFVFAPSRRQVTAEQVAAIVRELPAGVEKVGVFTSLDAEEILRTARVAGLTFVQLHSRFDPGLVEAVKAGSGGRLGVIQVLDVPLGVGLGQFGTALGAVLRHSDVAAALLDASHGGVSGGTGKSFEWGRVAETVREVRREAGGRVIVAGGLRAENVGEAIAEFAPWGVDVASGVEGVVGRKDPERMRAFLENARMARAR